MTTKPMPNEDLSLIDQIIDLCDLSKISGDDSYNEEALWALIHNIEDKAIELKDKMEAND